MSPTRPPTPRRAGSVRSQSERKERAARSTAQQRKQLELFFQRTPRPDTSQMQVLAEDLGMDADHVSQWFSSKRCRVKRSSGSSLVTPPATPSTGNMLQLTLPDVGVDDNALPQPKRGKPRVTQEQEDALQELFEREPHASLETKRDVAERIGLTPSKVNSWFTFTRATSVVKAEPSPAPSSPIYGPVRSLRTRLVRAPYATPSSSAASTPSLRPSRLSRAVSYMSDRSAEDSDRKKRTRPNAAQLAVLRRAFKASAPEYKPSLAKRKELAEELDMPVSKVTDWFRNSLASLKRRKGKNEEERDGSDDENEDEDDNERDREKSTQTLEGYESAESMESDGDETEDDLPLQTPRSTLAGRNPLPRIDIHCEPDLDAVRGASVLVGIARHWSPREVEDFCNERINMAAAAVDPLQKLALVASKSRACSPVPDARQDGTSGVTVL